MSIPYNLPSSIFRSRSESTSSEEDSSSEKDVGRTMLKPMFLTTAEQRTRLNMFGITNTEYTQTTIIDPVLYIALYSTGDAPSEVDDYHWTFIVGPSHEEADSKGTLYNMEPRRVPDYNRPYGVGGIEWAWLYNQPPVPLRGQYDLLARLMIAEVADMNMLQAIMLRWGGKVSMRMHVEWMSVRWVKDVLKSLDEDEGCLGRRMESFEGVEAEGRWLAEIEEEKRKGYCLLDTRISTRTFFEREKATALLSTATVDIPIKYPVLYVAVYKNDSSRHENDEYRWAFLIGPSNETAESEGVCCGVGLHPDSIDRPTWDYNQTIVPLRGEDDLLARMLIADVVNLGPLGEVIRDHDTTPTTERTDSIAEGSESSSLAWVREKLEMLERKPECFAYKCRDFSIFERVGRELAGEQWKTKKGVRPFGVEVKTRSLVPGWTKPDEDENKVVVKLHLARGETNTISRSIQIATGVLGAAAFEMRQRVAEREKRDMKNEQKGEMRAGYKLSENVTILAKREKTQGIEDRKAVKHQGEGGKGAAARPEGARVTTISFGKLPKPEEASEEEKDEDETESEKETEEDDDSASDDEGEDENGEDEVARRTAERKVEGKKANVRPEDVRRTNTVQIAVPSKPQNATGQRKVAEEDDEDNEETESEENENEEDEDGKDEKDSEEDGTESGENEGEENESEENEDEENGDEENEDGKDEDENDKTDSEEDETESEKNENEGDEDGKYGGVPTRLKKVSTITLN